jgi:hypothetical protein
MKIFLDTDSHILMTDFPDTMSSIKITEGELYILLKEINLITQRAVDEFKRGLKKGGKQNGGK